MIVKNLLYNFVRVEVEEGLFYDFNPREEKNIDGKYIEHPKFEELQEKGVLRLERG